MRRRTVVGRHRWGVKVAALAPRRSRLPVTRDVATTTLSVDVWCRCRSVVASLSVGVVCGEGEHCWCCQW